MGVGPPASPARQGSFSSALSLAPSTNWEWVPLVFLKINDIQCYKMYLSQPMFVYLWQLATICSGGDTMKPSFFGNIDFQGGESLPRPRHSGKESWQVKRTVDSLERWWRLHAHLTKSNLSRLFPALVAFPFMPSPLFKPCSPFLVRIPTGLVRSLLNRQCGLSDLGFLP